MQDKISKIDRENYLIKLRKEFAFAGAVIPERLEAGGRDLELRSYVFDIIRKKGSLTPEEREDADRTAALVRGKRREIVDRLAREDLTKAGAEELYRQAAGLGRALDTLHRAHEPKTTVDEESRKARMEDGLRWLNLVRKVYGREETKPRERP